MEKFKYSWLSAYIGSSGSGKTTLVDIILGVIQPIYGEVKMDGYNIIKIPDTWGKLIGYVPQNIFLLDDTIRNNVKFGVDCNDINDKIVWNCLEKAQIKEYVESLPQGLDTYVGERGVKLSGGQIQRIAIARAFFSNPQILVMDEATAALDNETESAVMEAIEALKGKITLIIVAHRLSTVKRCDVIYEIKIKV